MLRFRIIVAVSLLFLAVEGVAQIRIIPRESIEQVARPSTVAGSTMTIEGGNAISFGSIEEDGGVWECKVAWSNQGETPLVITRISSSCSCLQAEATRNAVRASEKGYITLRYYPKGHAGRVTQRVLIYTNLSDKQPTAVVTVSGVVEPSADRRGDYPCMLGTLLLRRDTITVHRGEQVRVACMNGGEQPLRVSTDALLSPQGVKAYTEPRELKAGEEGDLVITLPAELNTRRMPLYLQGIRVAPRQRQVILIVEE